MESADSAMSPPDVLGATAAPAILPDTVDIQPETEAAPSSPATQQSSPAAIRNAKSGRWLVNDMLDGWVLMGANDRPVMRADGSRVEFLFRDAATLAAKFAAPKTQPQSMPPMLLADPDSHDRADWDPSARNTHLVDVIESLRLLTYQNAQTTELEEALLGAAATLFGKPVVLAGERVEAFVPEQYDPEAVMAAAIGMASEILGTDARARDGYDVEAFSASSTAIIIFGGTKFNQAAARRNWELHYNKVWPYDEVLGRYYDVAHIVPRVLGGTEHPTNIVPMRHGEHVLSHKIDGIFRLGGAMGAAAKKAAREGKGPAEIAEAMETAKQRVLAELQKEYQMRAGLSGSPELPDSEKSAKGSTAAQETEGAKETKGPEGADEAKRSEGADQGKRAEKAKPPKGRIRSR